MSTDRSRLARLVKCGTAARRCLRRVKQGKSRPAIAAARERLLGIEAETIRAQLEGLEEGTIGFDILWRYRCALCLREQVPGYTVAMAGEVGLAWLRGLLLLEEGEHAY